jgi:sec-independent protein translocase protein TatB
VFGLSFGELCVLLLVAVVVLGPKELPKYLRKAGMFAGRLRRLAFEMREKSGIDEVLRTAGIEHDIAEIRKLARGEIGGVVAAVRSTADAARIGAGGPANGRSGLAARPSQAPALAPVPQPAPPEATPHAAGTVRSNQEYPREGADAYGALPDTALVYDGSFPASPLGEDALYVRGEEADPSVVAPLAESPPADAATGTVS